MRFLIALGLGGTVTLGLFYLMSVLVSSGKQQAEKKVDSNPMIEFVRLKVDDGAAETRAREAPQKPAPVQPQPSTPKTAVANEDNRPQAEGLDIDVPMAGGLALGGPAVKVGGGSAIGGGAAGGGGGGVDSEEMPIVRMDPQYPQQAAMKGLEGHVTLEFTITKAGSVTDVKVVESRPPRVFDDAARKALAQWKYRPKVVDGQPIDQPGKLVKLDFKLDNE
jgi:protein TonB